MLEKEQQDPKKVRYPRNADLDPQLVWRGKDEQDWSDLVVHAPPLYIQEKVHPKALIDDLLRSSKERRHDAGGVTADLFSDFNGIPKGVDKTEFYQHDQNWTNRMILGDSLQVMASLAEREGLRGKVQCIYFDPPYGIKFNSNFQWSTTSRDVKDGNAAHITREPEQVKAFRDTWRDGIHSYLTYLRDRLTVARDLLTESGSIFVQIGDDNVHRVRAVMDEVFGEYNCVSLMTAWVNFFNEMANNDQLDQDGTHDITNSNGWMGVHVALNNMQMGTIAPPEELAVDVTPGTGVSLHLVNQGCAITLDEPDAGDHPDFSWSNITYITQLVAQPFSSAFTVAIYYLDSDGMPQVAVVDGTMCEAFQLAPCNFPRLCDPNQLAQDVQDLWNMVHNNAGFTAGNLMLDSYTPAGTTEVRTDRPGDDRGSSS